MFNNVEEAVKDNFMQEKFVNINNLNTRVVEWGDKNKPIIFCIHGLGSTALSFIEIAETLKDRYYVVSVDIPGFGKSGHFLNSDDYDILNIVNWINKVVLELKIKNFYLLGHSWGAQIGLYYFNSYPEKVKKFLMLDGGYHIHKIIHEYNTKNNLPLASEQEEIDFYKQDFENYQFSSLNEFMESEKKAYSRWSSLLEVACKDLCRFENEKYRWHAKGVTAEFTLKGMYKFPPNLIYSDILNKKLSDRILLLQSALPKNQEEIMNILADKFSTETGSKLKKINDASHLIHWDNPEIVADEILNWFK